METIYSSKEYKMAGKRITDLDKSSIEERKTDGFVAVANSDTSFKVPLSDFNAENLGAQEKLQPAGDSSTPVYINGESKAAPISSPIQPVLGGTGETSLQDACNAMINSLTTGSTTPTDNDYIVTQFVGGGDTTKTYHRRKLSILWEWIKSKVNSLISNKKITIKVNSTSNSFTLNQNSDATLAFTTPAVPTVNNPTITISGNGKSGSFTLNQQGAKTIDLGSPSVTPGNGELKLNFGPERTGGTYSSVAFTANQKNGVVKTVGFNDLGPYKHDTWRKYNWIPTPSPDLTSGINGYLFPFTLVIEWKPHSGMNENYKKISYIVPDAWTSSDHLKTFGAKEPTNLRGIILNLGTGEYTIEGFYNGSTWKLPRYRFMTFLKIGTNYFREDT